MKDQELPDIQAKAHFNSEPVVISRASRPGEDDNDVCRERKLSDAYDDEETNERIRARLELERNLRGHYRRKERDCGYER